MGKYLSKPITTKNSSCGEGKSVIFGASSMQGWIYKMEVTYSYFTDLNQDVSIFGVFDGEEKIGGEAAQFAKRHFIEELQKNNNYNEQHFEEVLKETFLKMDEMLFSPEGQKELHSYKLDPLDQSEKSGCAANVAIFYKNTLYVANAGLAKSVLCRNDTNYDMSVDHHRDNPGEKERIEKARISEKNKFNAQPWNLNIIPLADSRCLGCLSYKIDADLKQDEQLLIATPDVKVEVLDIHDKFLLIGNRGLFENVEKKELIQFVNERLIAPPITPQLLERIAEELLDHLLCPVELFQQQGEQRGLLNMSVIIIYRKNI